MTTVRACQAKDPSTCRYHGSQIPAEQWVPKYDVSVAELQHLNEQLYGSGSKARLIEPKRQAAILDVNASTEGRRQLSAIIDSAQVHDSQRIWAEEQRRAADAHRIELLTTKAIEDFKSIEEDGGESDGYMLVNAHRLFYKTPTDVVDYGGNRVVIAATNGNTKLAFRDYDLDDAAGRQELIEHRASIGAEQQRLNAYSRSNLLKEVEDQLPAQALDYANANTVFISHNDKPYLKVEFNEDGTFRSASEARYADGSLSDVPGVTALRTILHKVEIGEREPKSLPEWVLPQTVS